jgi:hypothetical protein
MLAGDVNYPRAKEAIFLLFKSARLIIFHQGA